MTYDPFARGTDPVGVRTIQIRDDSRDREITVELWYPATDAYRGQDLDDATRDRFSVVPGVPDFVQDAVRGAEPADGRFPLILHCHGANSFRRDKTQLCTHLASHGYVVASPDFPGDTAMEMVQDEQSGAGKRSASMSIDELAEHRPLDARFVIDQVLAGADAAVAARVDSARIGSCGHSFGGWTSLALSSIDPRPRASFAMAPLWGKLSPIPQLRRVGPWLRLDDWGRAVATFLLAGERDSCVILEDLRELAALLPEPTRFAVLRNVGHMHFADNAELVHEWMRAMWSSPNFPDPEVDGPALAAATRPFSELCPAAPAMDAIRGLCLAHMDAHVKENPEAHAFLAGDLTGILRTRGIEVEVPSRVGSVA
jgi:dienelactone hydrolase